MSSDIERRTRTLLESRKFRSVLLLVLIMFVIIGIQLFIGPEYQSLLIAVVLAIGAGISSNILGISWEDAAEKAGVELTDGISIDEIERIVRLLIKEAVEAVRDSNVAQKAILGDFSGCMSRDEVEELVRKVVKESLYGVRGSGAELP